MLRKPAVCPGDEELLRFVSGELADPAPLEAHVTSCAECKALVAHLSAVGATVSLAPGGEDDLRKRRAQMLAARRTTSQHRLASGARVGRYTVLERVGAGGMGEVYAAYDPQLDRRIAIKLLHREGGELEQRLLREAQAMARLDHPNVVPVYDVGDHDGQKFVAMAFIAGATLRQWLDKPRTWREIVEAFVAAGEGLAAAHAAGIVHRDFKPDNVLVDERGLVRVTDFGLARTHVQAATPDAPVDSKTGIVGTPEFMAPEQIRGDDIDARADVFALCVALWRALYKQSPFCGGLLRERLAAIEAGAIVEPTESSVPRWVRAAIQPGLKARPADRPSTMRELLDALRADPAIRRRRVIAAGVGGAALVTVGTLWILRDDPAPEWRAKVENMQFYEENSDQAAISPDGKLVAYPSDRGGEGIRIFIEPLAGGGSRAITPPEHTAMHPNWRANGTAITYVDQNEWIGYELPVDGGTPRIVEKGVHDIEDCSGRWVINQMTSPGCPTCQRLIVRDAGGDREIARGEPGEWIIEPKCDRDGERVVYGRSPGNADVAPSSDLWLANIDGGAPPRRLTHDATKQNRYPTWGSDHSIVFSSKRGGNINLWELSLLDDGLRPITNGEGPDYSPVVTPDGERLMFNRDSTSTPLLANTNGKRRRITHTLDHFKEPQVTADGSELIAVVTRNGVDHAVAVVAATGDERMIGPGHAPALSHDESEMLYVPADAPSRLVVVSRRDLAKRRTLGDLPGTIHAIADGPDGIVHLRVRRSEALEAWRVSRAGVVERDAPAPWCQLLPGPRGGWVAAARCRGIQLELHLIKPGGSLDDPDAPVMTTRYVAWEPDGSALLLWSSKGVIRYALATGEKRVVAELDQIQGLAISESGTIYTTEVVGHVRRHLITNFGARPSL